VERVLDTIVEYFLEGQKDIIVNEFIGAFTTMKAEKA